MESETCVFVCLFVCLCGQIGVLGQVASLCRPQERFLACGGCQRTCRDPVPECKAICRTGCYCNEDEVRNDTGHCVQLADCPPLLSAYKLETSEPRPSDAQCPENEEYRFCEPCNRSCEHPDPPCPAQCARGCFCKPGYLRDSNGTCVLRHLCPNLLEKKASAENVTLTPQCGVDQIFKECETCEKTCSDPNLACPAQCSRGCFCRDGLVRSSDDQCVKLEDCPEANTIPTTICDEGEVLKECENCEKTCLTPNPICPAQCSRGCFCQEGLYKAPDGECVELQDCLNYNDWSKY